MSTGRRLAFSLMPLVMLVGAGEVGARLVGTEECEAIVPQATGWETMVGDPRYLWKLEPGRLFESENGTTRINAVGLRTALLPDEPKAADELRVLVTGDSSVYGWGQPDGKTYAEQLEKLLDRLTPQHRVRVVNLGVPGYSTVQTLRLLEDLGWSYDPDLLVVHNIFSDCNIDAFQDAAALSLADPDGSVARRLLHSSRLYCAAYMPWARFQAGVNQEPNRVLMPGMPTGANQATRLEAVDRVIDLSRVPLDDYLDNLDVIREEAASRGAGILVAPLAQEWDVGIWTAPMDPPVEGEVLPWHPYRTAQAAWAEDRGVARVYLPDAFAAAGIDKRRLFIDHMHPSVDGAAVMARAVAEAVVADPGLLGLDGQALGSLPPSHSGGQGAGGGQGAQGRPPGRPPGTPPPGTPPPQGGK